MGERITGNFDQEHVDGFEAMQEEDKADSYSEAVRIASHVGLQQLGYVNGQQKNTRLRAVSKRFADALALLGLCWVGLTFFHPIGFRAFAIPIFMMAIALYGVDRLLESVEPAVSNKITGIFRGEKA